MLVSSIYAIDPIYNVLHLAQGPASHASALRSRCTRAQQRVVSALRSGILGLHALSNTQTPYTRAQLRVGRRILHTLCGMSKSFRDLGSCSASCTRHEARPAAPPLRAPQRSTWVASAPAACRHPVHAPRSVPPQSAYSFHSAATRTASASSPRSLDAPCRSRSRPGHPRGSSSLQLAHARSADA